MSVALPVNGHRCWLSPLELRRVIDHERARADRTRQPFSLITLGWRRRRQPEATAALVRALNERLRCTDAVGWMAEDVVAVVLVDTDAAGARAAARAILDRYPAAIAPLQCAIATYPDDPMDGLFVQRMPPGKRLGDIVGAAIGLVLSAPLIALAIVAMKITSPGPAFFTQQRAGLGGRPFTIYKLRTMSDGAAAARASLAAQNEVDGAAFKLRRDPRVTRVGRLLRHLSIDELPQFWNVLVGDMSLVGPRPLPCDEAAACAPWQRHRLDVTPGLTGIWQVSGRNDVPFTDWMRMDLRYVRNRSLQQDATVMLRTVPAVLSGKGAF
jgi:lipopolysaccharide/colanic/teichoic acid biosynthesis glycosyltransferase